MKRQFIVRILIAAAVLGSLLAYMMKKDLFTEKKSEKELAREIYNYDKSNIDRVEFVDQDMRTGEALTIVCERPAGGAWRITKPTNFRADIPIIESASRAVASLRASERLYEEEDSKALLSRYSLDPPARIFRFHVRGEDDDHELHIGHMTALGDEYYVKDAYKRPLYTVNRNSIDPLQKTLRELRYKKIFDVDNTDVKKVTIRRKGKSDRVYEKNMSAGDYDIKWHITKPVRNDADDTVVREIIRKITGVRVVDFPNDFPKPGDIVNYGLDNARIQVILDLASTTTPVELWIGKKTDSKRKDSNYYARGSSSRGVYIVAHRLLDDIFKTVTEVRMKKIFLLDNSSITQVALSSPKTHITMKRSEEHEGQWEVSLKQPPPAVDLGILRPAAGLMNSILYLQANSWVADNPKRLAKYGLDIPRYTITMLSLNSDKRYVVSFGSKIPGTDMVYARANNRKAVFTVSKYLLDSAVNLEEDVLSRVNPAVKQPEPRPSVTMAMP